MASNVRPADIRALLDRMQKEFNFATSTVRKRYGALRMLFSWMVEEDIVVKNPVKRGDAPLAKAKQKPPWTLKNCTASGEESVLTIPIKRL
jgi:site-specific recombinase XerD